MENLNSKVLLLAVNAKYIHTNPAIYALRQYARKQCAELADSIVLREYTINHEPDAVLKGIYEVRPRVLCISCYIWNIRMVKELIADYKKIDPRVRIVLGGPEVTYDAGEFLQENPAADAVIVGEGEATFAELVERLYGVQSEWKASGSLREDGETTGRLPVKALAFLQVCENLRGVVYRAEDGRIVENLPRELLDFAALPFPYEDMGTLGDFEHKIIYYETSRGCPFLCCYCLSSVEKRVRFRKLELVKRELQSFLDARVAQVKFVDRTFNCKESHALAIWEYIREHDNGVTNFHFEIAADLLTERELSLLADMRPGLVQLEIGVQSVNPQTIEAIHRRMELGKVKAAVAAVRAGKNIHQHLDLIAGLPYEDYASFGHSYDEVYRMRPNQLQLGFLKVLKGSAMFDMAAEHEVRYKSEPPYEVLSTKYLTYDEIIRLKEIEELTEDYYNSGQFLYTLPFLERYFSTPFQMYEELAAYYRERGLFDVKHSRLSRYEWLYRFAQEYRERKLAGSAEEKARPVRRDEEAELREAGSPGATEPVWIEVLAELLMYDFCSREKPKSRPFFAHSQELCKEQWKAYRRENRANGAVETGQLAMEYFTYDVLRASATGEINRRESLAVFDYSKRDALYGCCEVVWLSDAPRPASTDLCP